MTERYVEEMHGIKVVIEECPCKMTEGCKACRGAGLIPTVGSLKRGIDRHRIAIADARSNFDTLDNLLNHLAKDQFLHDILNAMYDDLEATPETRQIVLRYGRIGRSRKGMPFIAEFYANAGNLSVGDDVLVAADFGHLPTFDDVKRVFITLTHEIRGRCTAQKQRIQVAENQIAGLEALIKDIEAVLRANATKQEPATPMLTPKPVKSKTCTRRSCKRDPRVWDKKGKGYCRRHAHEAGLLVREAEPGEPKKRKHRN